MKKSIQSLVFSLLLGVILVSCKKKEDAVAPCFDEAYKSITYTNAANNKSFKIENVACKVVTLKESNFSISDNSSATYEVAVTGGSPGNYTMNIAGSTINMAITATTMKITGAFSFDGVKK